MTDYTDLATYLRGELREMASIASVDMELWDRFSNRVLSAADALEAKDKRIAHLEEMHVECLREARKTTAALKAKDEMIAELKEQYTNANDANLKMGGKAREYEDRIHGLAYGNKLLQKRIAELEDELKFELRDRKEWKKMLGYYGARIAALEAHINYIESYIEKLIRSHIARADYSEKSSSGRKQRVRASEASGILGVIRAARAAMEGKDD